MKVYWTLKSIDDLPSGDTVANFCFSRYDEVKKESYVHTKEHFLTVDTAKMLLEKGMLDDYRAQDMRAICAAIIAADTPSKRKKAIDKPHLCSRTWEEL